MKESAYRKCGVKLGHLATCLGILEDQGFESLPHIHIYIIHKFSSSCPCTLNIGNKDMLYVKLTRDGLKVTRDGLRRGWALQAC